MKEKHVSYIEDSTFILPFIENSFLGLGDLWDCHDSKYSGFNLFTKKFTKDHLIFHPIKKLDYRLIHVKSIQDRLSAIKANGAMSIELLSGIIEVEGSDGYTVSSDKNSNEEQLICQYHLDNYFIELLPCTKDVIDEGVKDQLLTNKIKATHIVRRIIIGAEVNADIRIRQIDRTRDETIKDGYLGKLSCGLVSASLKASLETLDSENVKKLITIHSRPQIHQQPSTISQMFNSIEKVDMQISKERHFEFLDPNITGVPLRFVLVPITQFLDIKVEKLYKQLDNNILNNFCTMLVTLKDFQSPEYVKSCVLENENRLQTILSDPQSELSKKIAEYEKELKIEASKYFQQAYEELKNYKIAKCNSDQLLQVMNDFDRCEFSAINVYSNINAFSTMGKRELIDVHENDATFMKANILFFSSSDALNRWMDPESNSKILLYTKGSSPTGAFRRLFNISEALQKLKIEVGIALPSISENFSLVIKIHEKVEVYSSDEIPQILGIISAAIEMNGSIESQFYALKALHSKIQLPLQPEKIDDLNHLLSLLGKNEVHIAQSYMDTLKQIRCREDTRWKFFISLDALDTAFNSIKYCNTFSEYEWIVGDSGVQGLHAAPYLFVIRQGEIKAVCLDDLDFQILIKLFNVKANDEPDLSVLSPESLCYSFYPDRARFAIEMIKIVDQSKCHNFDTANLGIPLFKQVPDQRLTETLDIARSALSKNDLNVISSVACIVARNHNDIINLFTKHGWNSAESKFDIKASSEENWKSLYIGLESWLKLKDPFLAKVESIKKIIEQFNNNIAAENAEKIFIQEIDSISTDSQCPIDTKTNIESWKESDFKTQYTETLNVLNELSIELAKEKFFHVLELISLLKSFCQPFSHKFSIDVFNTILQRYIKRLPFDQDQFKSCRSLPELVSLLAKLNYDPQLYKLHQKLDDISGSGLDNEKAIINFFNLILNEKIENEKFWLNSRVICLIGFSPITMSKIARSKSYFNILSCMPDDIKKRLNEILQQENFEMPEILDDIDEVIKVFKHIIIIQDIEPEAFRSLIENSISKNEELKKSFESADALFYWNEKEKYFDQPWDIQTIKDAYSRLEQWKRSSNARATKPTIPVNFLDLDFKNIDKNIKKCNKKEINVHENWRPIMGETISMIATKDYVEVRAIISAPKIETTQEIACW